jgi:hypothetical protein
MVFVDEKSNSGEVASRDLSDLVITSEGCAKEEIISRLSASCDTIMCVMMMITLAR